MSTFLKENKRALIISGLTSGITTLITGLVSLLLKKVNIVTLLIIFIIFAATVYGYYKFVAGLDSGRQKGVFSITLLFLLLGIFAFWDNKMGLEMSQQIFIKESNVKALICGNHWITYDPMSYNPYQSPNPNVTTMETELEWIRNAGFDGVITFTSRDNFSYIPELAKKHNLQVIMGIWNPNDNNEITLAISKREYVDAYVIGHNGLYNPIAGNQSPYTEDDLIRAIHYVRYKTKRPVSTTETIKQYLNNPYLYSVGDWIFPDAHININTDMNADYVDESIKNLLEVATLISEQEERGRKPISLKMVTFPHNGFNGATYDSQAEFYKLLLDSRRDTVADMPSYICISVHSAFDTDWKKGYPFYEWDIYTGLISNSGIPNPATMEITKRQP